ncbi:VOC family protein [Halopseudomonas salegens]|uniref:Glyoxalase superfamily enzyme, possibly 3-demethylubiquinone-9 3-methyltransferase n=1 Tax=Halopseudomonas salegens TaxID=1434072 RepID=A0A1H2HYB8_9GAMM|nr:VOC family protein [Halopseudomonas salegens]SDU36764.1 Glyoxalase superfamily enzyme, possibly 3-demethylubiquinone-9 3-methyltransferase [Halopseudomonas salegens]
MTAAPQKIVPHLWFDKEAREAAEFYCSVFPDSSVTSSTTLHDTPGGDCDLVSFELSGYVFMAISAGPLFTFNPSVSFIVNFDPARDKDARSNLDLAWDKLAEGGKVLMPLDSYPFSERYGWIQDRFGLSWQLGLTGQAAPQRPFIVPSLLFVGDLCGKAEEAARFYRSVFNNTRIGEVARYPAGMEPDREGTLMYSDFTLEGQWFAAMDSAHQHDFAFNEAVSFLVNCSSQDEIDAYWQQLSAVPEAEQCGWLKDRYGLSWQAYPQVLTRMLLSPDAERVKRVTQAFLGMQKFDLAALHKAFDPND